MTDAMAPTNPTTVMIEKKTIMAIQTGSFNGLLVSFSHIIAGIVPE